MFLIDVSGSAFLGNLLDDRDNMLARLHAIAWHEGRKTESSVCVGAAARRAAGRWDEVDVCVGHWLAVHRHRAGHSRGGRPGRAAADDSDGYQQRKGDPGQSSSDGLRRLAG